MHRTILLQPVTSNDKNSYHTTYISPHNAPQSKFNLFTEQERRKISKKKQAFRYKLIFSLLSILLAISYILFLLGQTGLDMFISDIYAELSISTSPMPSIQIPSVMESSMSNGIIAEPSKIETDNSTQEQNILKTPTNFIQVENKSIKTLVITPDLKLPVTIGNFDKKNSTWSFVENSLMVASLETKKFDLLSGNTTIYGHRRKNILRDLKNIIKTDKDLEIILENDKILKYKYLDSAILDPKDTRIFNANFGTPTLTLITCDGLFDSSRLAVVYKLEQ